MSVSSIASVTRVPLLFVTAHACSVAGGEAGATTGARSGDEIMTMPQRTAIRPGVPGVPVQRPMGHRPMAAARSEEHTSELQSRQYLVCRLLLEKKKN